MPFSRSHDSGILRLKLHTTRSPVSVLRYPDVLQLLEIFNEVDPDRTRAVVFESHNPRSFLNGIERLRIQHAQVSQSPDLEIENFRRLFKAVHDSAVPTFAIVSGSCLGCGVEFALNFDYRIASSTYDTVFYMSQVSGTMGGATFGGTWLLPRLVGFREAVDLLIWGEPVRGIKAAQLGVADQVVPQEDLEKSTIPFVEQVLSQKNGVGGKRELSPLQGQEAKIEEVVALAEKRINDLPPSYQPIYRDWLRMLARGAVANNFEEHLREAVETAVKHASDPIPRQAMSFFFVHQAASELSGTVPHQEPTEMRVAIDSFEPHDSNFVAFVKELSLRKVPNLRWSPSSNIKAEVVFTTTANIERTRRPSSDGQLVISVVPSLMEGFHRPRYEPVLYAPNSRPKGQKQIVELAVAPECAADTKLLRQLSRLLAQLGFEVVMTREVETFLINRLLGAYMRTIVRYLILGGCAAQVDYSFRAYGFIRRPRDIVKEFGEEALTTFLKNLDSFSLTMEQKIAPALCSLKEATYQNADSVPGADIVHAVLLALLKEIKSALQAKILIHPSIADVVAREILDFPLQHLSLCYHLRKEGVAGMVDGLENLNDPLATEAATECVMKNAKDFLVGSKEFYR